LKFSNKKLKYLKDTKGLFILSFPAMLYFLIFSYLPMMGIIIAFKNYNFSKGILGSDWSGFTNFKFFFTSQDAFRITRNTIGLNFLFIIIGMPVSIILALLLFDLSKRAVKVFQTILFFPYFLSWVVVGFVTYILLNPSFGVMNSLLKSFHLQVIDWYANPKLWPFILVFVYIWKNAGYFAIIFYTGLLGIDSTYYEAAAIDGATKLQMIMKITIPLLVPLITMITLLQIGKIMYSDFGLFYFIPRDTGTLYSSVDVIDTYVFRSLRVVGDIGMASAAGLYQSIVGCVLVLVSNKVVKKFSEDNALF
jgi:putative aldouronate transport system permease protein